MRFVGRLDAVFVGRHMLGLVGSRKVESSPYWLTVCRTLGFLTRRSYGLKKVCFSGALNYCKHLEHGWLERGGPIGGVGLVIKYSLILSSYE